MCQTFLNTLIENHIQHNKSRIKESKIPLSVLINRIINGSVVDGQSKNPGSNPGIVESVSFSTERF